jgi:CO/xanthine dehydrogenase Mo-binding subunit
LVVAEIQEQASDAASRVQIAYKTAPFAVDDADPEARRPTAGNSQCRQGSTARCRSIKGRLLTA